MDKPELSLAVSAGDLDAVRSLLDADADVGYVRSSGMTVLIDVMYGRSIADDEQLLPILQLLIERGAELNAVSDYGESALSVASNMGRFDAVGVLLEAGADMAPLQRTPFLQSVAVGSAEDVRGQIEKGVDLADRDRWDRTAWLLSVQTGGVAKAEMLLSAGALIADRGRCGRTALMHAIRNRRAGMVEWLLEKGADPNETDDDGRSPLIEAAGIGDSECVRLLLVAGADVHHCYLSKPAIHVASNMETVRLLLGAGADLNDICDEMRAVLTRLPHDQSLNCTAEEYQAGKHPLYGNTNPERMEFPFWIAMIRGGQDAYQARGQFEPEVYTGYPIWCFRRFGKSINELPDGRIIEIAGEHEDAYDADFCIYNDVIVHNPDGTFDIYGYPEDIFPPTDFHTTTLVGRFLYIVGSIGYRGKRIFGTTPVYRLDIDTLAIEPVETTGTPPGWINRHRAKLVLDGIEVSGGKICEFADGVETSEDNPYSMLLELTADGAVWKSFSQT